ncbi:MAG: transposase [Planctomycetota bacterium]
MPQSLARILVHMVFSTKGRKPFLDNLEIRNELFRYIGGICRNIASNAVLNNGTADHIHILLSLAKNISVSDAIRTIKSNSSSWLKTNYSKYGRLSVAESVRRILRKQIERK